MRLTYVGVWTAGVRLVYQHNMCPIDFQISLMNLRILLVTGCAFEDDKSST